MAQQMVLPRQFLYRRTAVGMRRQDWEICRPTNGRIERDPYPFDVRAAFGIVRENLWRLSLCDENLRHSPIERVRYKVRQGWLSVASAR